MDGSGRPGAAAAGTGSARTGPARTGSAEPEHAAVRRERDGGPLMAAKRFDPKAKARKQKIVAAVLGVLFLGVMVYQAPTILGLFGGGSSRLPRARAAGASCTHGSTPGPPTPAAALAAAGSAQLVDTDVAPEPTQGQLVTFDRFESRTPSRSRPRKSRHERADGERRAQGQRPPTENLDDPTSESPAPPSPPAKTETATISVNGVSTQAIVGGTFPEDDPIFKLVSLTKRSAKIGIVDGTYATGSTTITLAKAASLVTLMNTADGTTYVLRLVSVG